MNHPRKTDDELIDHVLAALGTAEPATDLTERTKLLIQQTLQQHPAGQHQPRQPQPGQPQRILAWLHAAPANHARTVRYTCLAAAAVVILIVGTNAYRLTHPPQPARHPPQIAHATVQPAQPTISTVNTTPAPSIRHHAASHASVSPGTARDAHPAFRLVSYPAPPAPLTAQEKLLIRIAQTGDPEELAMLDPIARARETARSDEEFEKFIHQKESRRTQ